VTSVLAKEARTVDIPYRVEKVDRVGHEAVVDFTDVDVQLHRIKNDFGAEYLRGPCVHDDDTTKPNTTVHFHLNDQNVTDHTHHTAKHDTVSEKNIK